MSEEMKQCPQCSSPYGYAMGAELYACPECGNEWNPAEVEVEAGLKVVDASGYTFSSAESFAIDLWEGADAILIGTPTHGDTGNGASLFASSQGITFRIPTREPRVSAGGFPMEGKSIPPNHLVEPSLDDYLKGDDTALKYTLNLINQGIASKVDKQ